MNQGGHILKYAFAAGGCFAHPAGGKLSGAGGLVSQAL